LQESSTGRGQWGVMRSPFPVPDDHDLVSAFRAVLPQLKAKYEELGHVVYTPNPTAQKTQ
jgi:hypothetical protein